MMILNNSMILVSFFMVFSGLWSFVSYRKHLLNTLLSLEFIMLGIFFLLFFLTLAACEGALGLSLLVSIVRSHGNDYFNSFSTLGC
uniref:NADH-ubiquinone oxidoreductase chain 4L n=1 Tax=Pagurus minutus TaxID=1238396 RepID=A0A2Z5UY35_9EUCA|nr:NADH dehydrogenase subunit 4L [Pagurus minutus]